jgi:hypothetical protein
MCFILQRDCPCCRDRVWHCLDCWNKYHFGLRDKDWIPPKFKDQPLFNEEVVQKYRDLYPERDK